MRLPAEWQRVKATILTPYDNKEEREAIKNPVELFFLALAVKKAELD